MKSKKLKTSQAAARVGVHPETIRRWVRAGQLEASRTLGGHIRVDASDLERRTK